MKNTYTGTRERILYASSVEEAQQVFGSLTGYPKHYVNRCKHALDRCTARFTKELAKPTTKPAAQATPEVKDWEPGSEAPKTKKYGYAKGKKK